MPLYSLCNFFRLPSQKKDLESLYKTQAIDLNFLESGFFRLAHFSTPQFIPVDKLTQFLGKSVYIQLLRKYSIAPGGPNRLGIIPNKLLVDYIHGKNTTKKKFSSSYYAFVNRICNKALGVKTISLELFNTVIGSHFYPYFGDEWFSHLLRQYKYNPAPLSQLEDFHNLKNKISKENITAIANSEKTKKFLNSLQPSKQRTTKSKKPPKIIYDYEEYPEDSRIKLQSFSFGN